MRRLRTILAIGAATALVVAGCAEASQPEHPDKTRAMVLDGAVDPELRWADQVEPGAAAFEKALDSFAEWCQQTPEDCPLQPDARAAPTWLRLVRTSGTAVDAGEGAAEVVG